MANTHVESLTYSDWSVTTSAHSSYMSGSSSGLGTKRSSLIPVNRVTGVISGSVRGGYGWVAAHDEDEEPEHDDDLKVELTVALYLVSAGGARVLLTSAKGSAGRGGFLNLYDHSTSASMSYNTANLTDEQKAAYPYLQVEYTCVTSKSSLRCDRETDYENSDSGNPYGSTSWTIRDTINVNYDGNEMMDVFFDNVAMRSLEYDGNVIF